jgi:hypothetical protein
MKSCRKIINHQEKDSTVKEWTDTMRQKKANSVGICYGLTSGNTRPSERLH